MGKCGWVFHSPASVFPPVWRIAVSVGYSLPSAAGSGAGQPPRRWGNTDKSARKYLKEPITCNFVSYGNNIVAASINETLDVVSEYMGKFEFYHCFETPNMHWLNERLIEKGHKICFMAEYYLPDINRMPVLSCAYKTRILKQGDFEEWYLPEWSNALCKDRKHLDVLGVGAYDENILVGLAACSAD